MQRTTSFHDWLENRQEEIPDATQLALQIARSGAAGVSREDLEKVLRFSSETLDDVLRGLIVAGQVVVVKVGGRIVYRAA
jgi:predicted transcriptional regulator